MALVLVKRLRNKKATALTVDGQNAQTEVAEEPTQAEATESVESPEQAEQPEQAE